MLALAFARVRLVDGRLPCSTYQSTSRILKFSRALSLLIHYQRHHSNRPYFQKPNHSEYNLKSHVIVNSNTNPILFAMSASATNNSAQSEEVATKGKGKAMDAGRDVEMDEDDESGEEESGVDEQVEGTFSML